MPYQVSVFSENKPGKINKITTVLSENQINIRAITISDAGDYGIIKLLLDNPEKATELLNDNGITATLKEIVAVDLSDESGGLAKVAKILDENNINVDDAYGFLVESHKEAVFVFQVQNPHTAQSILSKHDFKILSDQELYLI